MNFYSGQCFMFVYDQYFILYFNITTIIEAQNFQMVGSRILNFAWATSISQANHLYLTQGSRTINPNFRLKLFYSLIKGISASLCGFSAKRTSSYVTVLRFLKIRNWIKPKIVTAKKIIIQTTISEVTYAGL